MYTLIYIYNTVIYTCLNKLTHTHNIYIYTNTHILSGKIGFK